MRSYLAPKRRQSDNSVHLPSAMSYDKDFFMGSDECSDASWKSEKPNKKATTTSLSLADLTPHERLVFKLKIAL